MGVCPFPTKFLWNSRIVHTAVQLRRGLNATLCFCLPLLCSVVLCRPASHAKYKGQKKAAEHVVCFKLFKAMQNSLHVAELAVMHCALTFRYAFLAIPMAS